MYMKKNYFIFAAALMALASCQTDDYLGNNPGNAEGTTEGAIRFDGGTGKITRADENPKTGATAAELLGKNFVVYGYKSFTTDNKTQVVYDNYDVNYLGDNTKSDSNTKGWEYVGQGAKKDQSIKYWDYSASQYDFVAFSFGKDNKTGDNFNVTTQKVEKGEDGKLSISLTGKVEDLAKCYFADQVTAKNQESTQKYTQGKYGEPVTFNFRSLSTKVQLGIFETIPGYSVKDVKFYDGTTSTTGNPDDKPKLYTSPTTSKTIPASSGTMKITYGTDYLASVTWTVGTEEGNENTNQITWNQLDGKVAKQNKEDDDTDNKIYIGRESSTASKSGYATVLPGNTVGALNMKVDYTLVSIDGSKEEINVKGATVTIPASYTQWKPNYAYTYIFKISDKTNGSTGTPGTDPAGLFPITFDAVVTETETGKQETITEIDDASITTYSKGEIKNNEYATGSNIYVSVPNSKLVLATSENQAANCALYKATLTGSNQPITEALVKKCLEGTAGEDGNYTLTLDTNAKLTISKVGSSDNDKLELVDKIASDDTVDGKEISSSFNFAKFKAAASATTYVFEFTDTKTTGDQNQGTKTTKYYKVIKVVAAQQNSIVPSSN